MSSQDLIFIYLGRNPEVLEDMRIFLQEYDGNTLLPEILHIYFRHRIGGTELELT